MNESFKTFLRNNLPKGIIIFFRKIKLFKFIIKKKFLSRDSIKISEYKNYQDYINHQKEKTTDPNRVKKWLKDEWDYKYKGFKAVFKKNKKFIKDKKNAICLGSRTGQEVKALVDLGINTIGLDLVSFPPFTIEGDIHNINYQKSEFDLVFTNILDHSLYPDKFCKEMERICKPSGIIILRLQIGISGDTYSSNTINNPDYILKLFKNSKPLKKDLIVDAFDGMNYEIVLKREN